LLCLFYIDNAYLNYLIFRESFHVTLHENFSAISLFQVTQKRGHLMSHLTKEINNRTRGEIAAIPSTSTNNNSRNNNKKK
jgi:hypothetical protein